MRTQEDMLEWDELEPALDELSKPLIQTVPGFKPQCEISDILYKDKR
jgi:hypothetical protein